MKDKQEMLTGNLKLSVDGHPTVIKVTVPAKPVKIRTMLPVFQNATDRFVELSVKKAEAEGRKISCKAGCGDCCRQPVPIAESEAHMLKEIIEQMPEPRKTSVKNRFYKAYDHFEKIGWLKKMSETSIIENQKARNKIRSELAWEYFSESIPCPFLEDEACSIYKDRPLICREYLVTSPAKYCADPIKNGEKVEPIEMGIKSSKALLEMAVHKESGQSINFLPMVALLKWTGDFAENHQMKTGEQWVAEFFSILAGKKLSV